MITAEADGNGSSHVEHLLGNSISKSCCWYHTLRASPPGVSSLLGADVERCQYCRGIPDRAGSEAPRRRAQEARPHTGTAQASWCLGAAEQKSSECPRMPGAQAWGRLGTRTLHTQTSQQTVTPAGAGRGVSGLVQRCSHNALLRASFPNLWRSPGGLGATPREHRVFSLDAGYSEDKQPSSTELRPLPHFVPKALFLQLGSRPAVLREPLLGHG